MEIYIPNMQALAQHMDEEKEHEILLSQTQSVLPQPWAAEVDIKTWQVMHVKQGSYGKNIKIFWNNWNETKIKYKWKTYTKQKLKLN